MLLVIALKLVYILCVSVKGITGHGYLMDPPQRSSLWREFRGAPVNYNDNSLNCGGFQRQWVHNGGKCGVCGDPFDLPVPRPNEDGGTFGRGIISRRYITGDVIDVAVMMTANHFGWFEFRLCPHDINNTTAMLECLDKNTLMVSSKFQLFSVGQTRYNLNDAKGAVYLRVKLPDRLECHKCVLQWKYNTGNSWGCDTECCGLGCGKQEQFINCADIRITQSKRRVSTQSDTHPEIHPRSEKEDDDSKEKDTSVKVQKDNKLVDKDSWKNCVPVGIWTSISFMKTWCLENCRNKNCPRTHCICK